jgi:site-specific recombinase XerD
MKYIRIFKTVFKAAWSYGYTDKDPFQKYKIRLEEVVRTYLSEKEIKNLMELDRVGNKLSRVRDWFLFSCFTGLAYIDLKNLCAKHIQLENGKYWIRTRRQKTNVKTNVPMLDLPLQIIKRYCPDFETRNGEDKIFMIISNQKTNAYLKELAKDCTISKNLTFHLARHTFATTITLNNNVPIESVSSMLGHKNITTTQHYAKLLDKKLEVDMENLDARLNYGKTKSRGT